MKRCVSPGGLIAAFPRFCCSQSLWPSANEITTAPLSDTVKPYDKHFIVHTGHASWIKTFPEGESDSIKSIFNNFKAVQKSLPFESGSVPKISGCHLPSPTPEETKIIVLPDASEYYLGKDTIQEDFEKMMKSIASDSKENAKQIDSKYKHHVLICSHEAVDKRCGFCGPRLYETFLDRLRHFKIEDQVLLMKTTHLGGHKFAGNVIVYPSGDWFGYVTPALVDEIITGTIINTFQPNGNSPIQQAWRGSMHPLTKN